MKLLLDTHIWLWCLLEPKRLTRRVTKAVRAPKNELWLSPVSVWEALLLIEAKRIRVKEDPRSWVDRVLTEVPMTEAPLTHQVALQSASVGLAHADPADRFLAATASVYELVLITADEKLLGGSGYRTLEN